MIQNIYINVTSVLAICNISCSNNNFLKDVFPSKAPIRKISKTRFLHQFLPFVNFFFILLTIASPYLPFSTDPALTGPDS